MNVGGNLKIPGLSEYQKSRGKHTGGRRHPRGESPQPCSVYLGSCDRTSYKHLPLPKGWGRGRVKSTSPQV